MGLLTVVRFLGGVVALRFSHISTTPFFFVCGLSCIRGVPIRHGASLTISRTGEAGPWI
jgi:hypothetical protein